MRIKILTFTIALIALTTVFLLKNTNKMYEKRTTNLLNIESSIQELRGSYLRSEYEKLVKPPQAFTPKGEVHLNPPLLLSDMKKTQGYGITPHIKAYGGMGLGGHPGIDWVAESGTSVYAAHDGIVFYAHRTHDNAVDGKVGYGNNIKLRARKGKEGYETVYAHLSEVLVSDGELVRSGDIIGKVGDTGFSSAPHLHFGIRFLWFCNDTDEVWTPCKIIDGDNGMLGLVDPLSYMTLQ